jgi:hypothetical protein
MDPMFNSDLSAPEVLDAEGPDLVRPDFFPDQRASGSRRSTSSAPTSGSCRSRRSIRPRPTPKARLTRSWSRCRRRQAARDEVKAVAEFLATPQGIQNWIRAGSAISTNSTTPADWYAGAYKLKVAADIVAKAKGIGFDASDLMPGAVGAGTFWTKSVAWHEWWRQ